jgi:hypothetical protein
MATARRRHVPEAGGALRVLLVTISWPEPSVQESLQVAFNQQGA